MTKITKTKEEEGLGIRDSAYYNKALLLKRLWKLHESPNSLCSSVLNKKYVRHQHILISLISAPNIANNMWKSMCKLAPILQSHMFHQIGNVRDTPITANWIQQHPLPDPCPDMSIHFVSDIIDPDSNTRIHDKINTNFPTPTTHHIQSTYLPPTPSPNKLIWPYSTISNYTTKTGYKAITNQTNNTHHQTQQPPPNNFKTIWQAEYPPKIRLFLWKANLEGLHTFATLHRMHITTTDQCPVCKSAPDTYG